MKHTTIIAELAVPRLVVTNAPQVCGTLKRELQPDTQLLVNFSRVEYLDSAAMAEIVLLCGEASKMSTRISLCNLQPQVMRLLKAVHFDMIIQLHATLEDALLAA